MQYLKEDIQEKILHIAEEVFSEKGYKDASMREIASEQGLQSATSIIISPIRMRYSARF